MVTIHPPARLVCEPKKTKKKGRKTPKQWQTGYSPRPPTSSDQNQTLDGGWPAVCSYTYQVWSKSVKGLRRCGGRKWPFPITLASGLYNSLYYRTSRDLGLSELRNPWIDWRKIGHLVVTSKRWPRTPNFVKFGCTRASQQYGEMCTSHTFFTFLQEISRAPL